MTRQQQFDAVRAVLREQQFAVFAFAGESNAPPYSAVMFCAETADLDLIFATSGDSRKARYLRDGNGACALMDRRAAGLENPADFARVTVPGYVQQVHAQERDDLQRTYAEKIPAAAVFLDRPGVATYRLRPTRIVYARGFVGGFELDLARA